MIIYKNGVIILFKDMFKICINLAVVVALRMRVNKSIISIRNKRKIHY